jgi:hypothetical protein
MVYAHKRVELDYPGQHSDEPALVIRQKDSSRRVYFPTDIDRNIWTQGSVDLSRLLQKSVQWMLNGRLPLRVEGEGMIEIFAWETAAGYALHILNYNNPNMTRASVRRHYPIGEQKVRMELPMGVTINRAALLRAETQLRVTQTGNVVEFVIPAIEDFEIAALYTS